MLIEGLTNMLEKKINYLNSITETLKDEDLLGNTVLRQWEVLVDLVEQTNSLNLVKSSVISKTETDIAPVTPENFRKRISMLNQEFKDHELGIEIKNSKSNVAIIIDEQKFNVNLNQQAAEFIKQSNEHNELDGDKLVIPQASPTPKHSKRQVLFSYSWEPNEEELKAQREFATRLEDGLKNPPAKYQNSDRVSLFIDYKDFELGEDQTEQQDAMCQETPIAVICYTHKYLYSPACQREIDYYLSKDGNNLPHRRALILPFDCTFGDMDSRFKKNLALTPPANFCNGLDFFSSASPAEKKALINQLVENIYSWFDNNPNPPKYDKHFEVKTTLRETGNRLDLPVQAPEFLKGSTRQHKYDGAVDIVKFMYDWSTSIDDSNTRLFYLLGDFGSGKSTSCQMLTKKLMDNYNANIADSDKQENPPVLPIYLDLKKLLNAFSDQKDIAIQPINSLLETMLSITGITKKVSGDSIIQFINDYPCLLIFDGFDEVGQKLNAQQQTGLLNKLLEIFPKNVYQQDLKRLNDDDNNNNPSSVPINSRILISCRTHFFKNYAQQEAFHQLYYRHEAGVSDGDIKNYQVYYLLPFTKQQIENYLINWLGEEDAEKALTFINNVHDLSGLSERPLMLNLIRDLLPELQEEFALNPHINASTLYKLLFDKVGYRDNEKHLIPLDEKRKLLGRFGLYLWQQGITTLHVEELDNWMIQNREDYPQLNIKLLSGQYDPEVILQDLHNASLLVRDNDDEYRFAHTSFLEFFVAVGIFDTTIHSQNTQDGFDAILTRDNMSKEIIQFLLDWRLTSREPDRQKFDKHWQLLQQADSSISARQIALDIWYFAYRANQDFVKLIQPNWKGLKLVNLKLDKQSKDNSLDLRGANLSGTSIEECDFSFVDLSDADLTGAFLRQNTFEKCRFDSIISEGISVLSNRFLDCPQAHIFEGRNNLIMPKPISNKEGSLLYRACDRAVKGISFSPDSKLIAILSLYYISIWDLNSQSCIGNIPNMCNDGSLISFSKDNEHIYASNDTGISVINIYTQKTIKKFEIDHPWQCCISGDEKFCFISSADKISIWDIINFKAIINVDNIYDEICQVSYKDNAFVFNTYGSDLIFSIMCHKNSKVEILKDINSEYENIEVYKSSNFSFKTLVKKETAKAISENSINNFKLIDTYKNYQLYDNMVSLILLVDITSNEKFFINYPETEFNSISKYISWSLDDKFLAFEAGRAVYLYDLRMKKVIFSFPYIERKNILNLIHHNDSSYRFDSYFSNYNHSVIEHDEIDDFETNYNTELFLTNTDYKGNSVDRYYSNDFKYAILSQESKSCIFDFTNNECHDVKDNLYYCPSVINIPNQSLLLFIQFDSVYLYSTNSFKCKTIISISEVLECACYCELTNFVFIGGTQNVSVLNLSTLEVVYQLPMTYSAMDLLTSKDGKTVMVNSILGISIWDTQTFECIKRVQIFEDAYIEFADEEFQQITRIGGKAWKYLTNVVTDDKGEVHALSPDTHPDWDKAYQS